MPNWICEQNHANLWVILWRPERKQPNLVPLVPMLLTPYESNQPLPTLLLESWLLGGNGGSLPPNSGWWFESTKHVLKEFPREKTPMVVATLWPKHDGNIYWSSWKKILIHAGRFAYNIISIANLNWYLRNHLRCLRSSHRAARSHPLMVSRMYISTSDCGPWMWKAESWMEPRSAPNKTRCIWCIYLHLDRINYQNVGKYM